MTELIPYLSFDGNALEAIRFYEKVFGVEAFVTKYGDWPQEFENGVPTDVADRVMHAEIRTDDFAMFISDRFISDTPYVVGEGVMLTLSVETGEDTKAWFDKLGADNQQVLMPFEATSFSDGYVQFIDKFGIPWQIIADMQEKD